ncbi:MAG: VTT domain-containing protein [Candidatus Solibacter sp.]|nr:VTT domain-containing protein [Candidatus Solibacter sp.]
MLKSIGDALIAFGPVGVFVIGLFDSLGVPLVGGVDFLLIYLAVNTPHMAYIAATTATMGSILGNLILFRAARYGVRRFANVEAPEGRRRKFRLWFQRYGLLTVFIPAVTPVVPLPLKFFVISAGAMHTPLRRFLGVVLLARVIRYYGEAYLGIRLGEDARGFLTHNAWNIAAIAVAVALVLVGLVRWYDRRRVEA